ncbi:hypothetical protein PMAYCL1PPCAC_03910, partial [Pristionchus mayeri]
ASDNFGRDRQRIPPRCCTSLNFYIMKEFLEGKHLSVLLSTIAAFTLQEYSNRKRDSLHMLSSGLLILAFAASVKGDSPLKSPPKPLVTQDDKYLRVTVDPFWTQQYWIKLDTTNLTLCYAFVVEAAEQCDGKVFSTEFIIDTTPTLTCAKRIPITISNAHTDANQKSYEVQLGREIFHSADEVEFFIRVSVRRNNETTGERFAATEINSEKVHFRISGRAHLLSSQIEPISAGFFIMALICITIFVKRSDAHKASALPFRMERNNVNKQKIPIIRESIEEHRIR